MPARTDQHQHEQTAPPVRSVHACVGVVSILIVAASITLATWLAVRPSVWDKANWGQLDGMSKEQVLSLRGDPDPTPMIPGWDMTFTAGFFIEVDACLAIKLHDDMVIDWAEFSGDTTTPEPRWQVKRTAGSQR